MSEETCPNDGYMLISGKCEKCNFILSNDQPEVTIIFNENRRLIARIAVLELALKSAIETLKIEFNVDITDPLERVLSGDSHE